MAETAVERESTYLLHNTGLLLWRASLLRGRLGCGLAGLGLGDDLLLGGLGALDHRRSVDGGEDTRFGIAGRRARSFASHFILILRVD